MFFSPLLIFTVFYLFWVLWIHCCEILQWFCKLNIRLVRTTPTQIKLALNWDQANGPTITHNFTSTSLYFGSCTAGQWQPGSKGKSKEDDWHRQQAPSGQTFVRPITGRTSLGNRCKNTWDFVPKSCHTKILHSGFIPGISEVSAIVCIWSLYIQLFRIRLWKRGWRKFLRSSLHQMFHHLLLL